MKKNVATIILAAGIGARMKSSVAKVLHPLCGRPMIDYVLDLNKELKVNNTVVVVGHKADEVKKHLPTGIKTVVQTKLLGTADAVSRALPALKSFKGTVVILYGDVPLLKAETIKKLIQRHSENNLAATLLVAQVKDSMGYGRILRDKYNSISRIVEEKDANDFELEIKEINTGIICFNKDKLTSALKAVRPNNSKKEYYLTDVISILYKRGEVVEGLKIKDAAEAMGVNSQADLAKANRVIRLRILEDLMKAGVKIVDPQTTYIDWGVKVGRDTIIYPFTIIENNVKLGKFCSIGPFCHLRPAVTLEDNITIGNFTEVVRSSISKGCFMKHFSYLGDSRIGKNVNIGAGAVTANFNGREKNVTVIGDNAFIGSDAILVAPVKVGKAAVVGAGSVVPKNKNVPDNAVVTGVPARAIKKRK